MKTTEEPSPDYIDAALDRIDTGIRHKRRHARRKRTGLITGGVLVLSIAGIGAATVWPAAASMPYIVCMQSPDLAAAMSTVGVGVDMRDPVGFCIDHAEFDPATADAVRVTWAETPRTDLVACKLAEGVAGVFPGPDVGDVCFELGLTAWTADDAVTAAQLKAAVDAWQLEKFDMAPTQVEITPSQIVSG